MKQKSMNATILLVLLAVVVGVGIASYFGGSASTVDDTQIATDDGVVGKWANKIVNYELIVDDRFTGIDVSATAKVYEEQPEDWENPRGDFDNAEEYTLYSAVSGEISIDKEFPATYFVVLEATGYNTEFLTITIPDGSGRTEDLADYQAEPDRLPAEMTQLGTTTDEDFALTLVNDTSVELKDTLLLTVDENTEFRGWKAVISDEIGFSTDADSDGIYDESLSRLYLSVGGRNIEVFDPDNGVDEFDSNDEYTLSLDGITVADENDIVIKYEMSVDETTDGSPSANDEKLSEGEGVVAQIRIFDAESNLFATIDITA